MKGALAHDKPVVELLYSAGNPAPRTTFDHVAIFGYMLHGSVVQVWPRDPTQQGEHNIRVTGGNLVKPGKLGTLDTWDILDRENDSTALLGRLLSEWVSEHGVP